MAGFAKLLIAPALWLSLTSMHGPWPEPADAMPVKAEVMPLPPAPPPPPPPVFVQDVLADGVVIVVSKASQRMYVYADGALWATSPVSTGKRGKATPAGTFAILQKKVFHRSNLYSNAPMPYMQRLTWSGIAMHAGHLPGYPASHGCIRLPRAFAKSLYDLTRHSSTAVIVTDEALPTDASAFALAAASDAAVPMHERFRADRAVMLVRGDGARTPAQVRPVTASPALAAKSVGRGQTIQLVAAASQREAEAHWSELVRTRPELAQMRPTIAAAVVNSRQYFRLRASAPGAHAVCGDLKKAGIECFAVI